MLGQILDTAREKGYICRDVSVKSDYETITKKITTMAEQYYSGNISINRDKKSPYWMVTFTDKQGRQRRRSTKVPVAGGMFEGQHISAKAAEKIAFQRGVQIACAKEEKDNARNNITVREHFDRFLMRSIGKVTEATIYNAKTSYKLFFAFLGARANEPLADITKSEIKDFVAARRNKVRYASARKDLSAISAAFTDALDSDIIQKNPCTGVKVKQDAASERIVKEPFTVEEVQELIEKLPEEWSSMVRCCFETYGQRLSDIAGLDWSSFYWEQKMVKICTGKVGRVMILPMRPEFYAWARAKWEAAGKPASGLLHPNIAARGRQISADFGAMVELMGISKRGISGRRNKTFHCIRSTCATLMHTAGMTETMAMKLVGHASKEVHAVYVKPTLDELRAAAMQMRGLNDQEKRG